MYLPKKPSNTLLGYQNSMAKSLVIVRHLFLNLLLLTLPGIALAVPSVSQSIAHYGQLPLSFESNQGQTDARVNYVARGGGYTLFLTPSEAILALSPISGTATESPSVIRMQLLGANPAATASGLQPLPGTSNYFVGRDSSHWQRNISNVAKVEYHDVYPGVNMVYYGKQRQLEYDFVLAPGAKPSDIQLAFVGATLQLDKQGNLVLHTSGGDLVQHSPVIYQTLQGERKIIDGQYALNTDANGKQTVSFQVAAYDRSQPLVIDPVLSYSTYLGGSGSDAAYGVAVDGVGNAYITGSTATLNLLSTNGAAQLNYGGGTSDAFISKLNADGSAVVYTTYLGGNNSDTGRGIKVDAAGNAYIVGTTSSANFPTTSGVIQSIASGPSDIFVVKLNDSGTSLIYASLLGGNGTDNGIAIALDISGNAYITGMTNSSNFPIKNAAQGAPSRSQIDAFVSKLNPTATSLDYSTYLGGSGVDNGLAIAVDNDGSAYVAGSTASGLKVTTGVLQTAVGGKGDGFITKLDFLGKLSYSTYLGGSGADVIQGIALDSNNNAYVTGNTASSNFNVTAGALRTTLAGGKDGFASKVNAAGTALVYSTYLGGNGNDFGNGIAVDAAGNATVTGSTNSTNFPLVLGSGAIGLDDIFVTTFNATGTSLTLSTLLGGANADQGWGVALDSSANIYLAGVTNSSNFPAVNAMQGSTGGSSDAFVMKISPGLNSTGVTASPTSLDFGSTVLSSTPLSITKTVNLINLGTLAVPMNIGFSNGGQSVFSQTNTCGASLAAGARCTVSVTFATLAGGSWSNSVVNNGVHVATLSGSASYPVVTASPTSLAFGNIVLSSTPLSITKTITVTNPGTVAVPMNIGFSNGGQSVFSRTHTCGTTLAAGASCTVSVTFATTTAGYWGETLLINNDTVSVHVSGSAN